LRISDFEFRIENNKMQIKNSIWIPQSAFRIPKSANSFVIVIINFSSKNSEKLCLIVLSGIYGIIFLVEEHNRII